MSEQRKGCLWYCGIYITKGDEVLASWIHFTGKHKWPLYIFYFLFCASLSPLLSLLPEPFLQHFEQPENRAKPKAIILSLLMCRMLRRAQMLPRAFYDNIWYLVNRKYITVRWEDPVCVIMITVLPEWTLLQEYKKHAQDCQYFIHIFNFPQALSAPKIYFFNCPGKISSLSTLLFPIL